MGSSKRPTTSDNKKSRHAQQSEDEEEACAVNTKLRNLKTKRSLRIVDNDDGDTPDEVHVPPTSSSRSVVNRAPLSAAHQTLTIVVDTSNTTPSSSSNSKTNQLMVDKHSSELKAAQLLAEKHESEMKTAEILADKHARDLILAQKLENTKLEVQRAKDLEDLKQRQHDDRLKRERERLDLDSQRHEVQIKAAQRQLDIENQRSQLHHDEESRFYQQLKREADKNTHNTAMARQSASADIDIQRGQWQLRRDIQDWEDKRLAKQSQEHRQNVERDSQIAWQREDALRRQRSQNSWYSSAATCDSNSFEQSTKRQEKRKYPHQDHTKKGKKRKREDDEEDDEEDEDDDEEQDEEQDEEDEREERPTNSKKDSKKLIAAPFKLKSN